MNTPTRRLGAVVFLLGAMVLFQGSAAAAIVTVTFSGEGTGDYAGKSFSGYVVYDSAQTGTFGVFNFNGSTKQHALHFEGDDIPNTTVKQSDCEPFQLVTNTTTNKLLKVNAITSTTTVLASFPTNVLIYRTLPPLNTLPTCVQGTGTKVFVAAPAAGTAPFTLSGDINFTGDIKYVICNMN